MKEKFSFLNDPRALAEIRSHKWLESEKKGEEIGFATAALDWIKKYGEAWKRYYLKQDSVSDLFIEKRRYRRFSLKLDLLIKKDKTAITVAPKDINLEAIACKSAHNFPIDTPVEIILKSKDKADIAYEDPLKCKAKILRFSPTSKNNLGGQEYNLVLIPTEEARDILKQILSYNLSLSISN